MTSPHALAEVDSYDAVAAEYYDPARHPTAANFRWASERLIDGLLGDVPDGALCEVGAGDSVLAALLVRRRQSLENLLLTDRSSSMLLYSKRWEERGARLAVAPADALPVSDRSLDLLVASLADPYDDLRWWREARRVLAPGGRVLLTTPAVGWARSFRQAAEEPPGSARFLRADGTSVDMPSHVRIPAAERALVETAGLRVVAEAQVTRGELEPPISLKLDVVTAEEPVVVAYAAAH